MSQTFNPLLKLGLDNTGDAAASVDLATGVTGTLPIGNGGTGQTGAQAAIDALTQVSAATNEHVLTKDTATGNAIFKAAAAGSWTDSGTTLYNTTTTDDVVVGASSPVSSAKLSVDGDADQRQCVIQGHSTQTDNVFEVQKSDGTVLFGVANSGALTAGGTTAGIYDTNGNEEILFTATGSAVNELTIANAATGNAPVISTTGGDTNIGLTLTPKGTGAIKAYSGDTAVAGFVSRVISTGVGTQTLTNSTASDQDFTSPFTFPANAIYTNKVYRVTFCIEAISGTSSVTRIYYMKLGSTKVFTSSANDVTNGVTQSMSFSFMIYGRAAAGASANVTTAPVGSTLDGSQTNRVNQPVALATNGTLTINFGVTYSGTGSTETDEQQAYIIEEIA